MKEIVKAAAEKVMGSLNTALYVALKTLRKEGCNVDDLAEALEAYEAWKAGK